MGKSLAFLTRLFMTLILVLVNNMEAHLPRSARGGIFKVFLHKVISLFLAFFLLLSSSFCFVIPTVAKQNFSVILETEVCVHTG